MTEISLKFNPEFVPLILNGKKTVTTRLKPKGKVGDTFDVEGKKYRIVDVRKHKLCACLSCFPFEGFHSSTEFYKALKRIYPEITLDSTVYVHEFIPVKEAV